MNVGNVSGFVFLSLAAFNEAFPNAETIFAETCWKKVSFLSE